jgi:hypothetical protein
VPNTGFKSAAGSLSVKLTALTVLGPLLLTVMV